jgi:hypothetical protein
MRRWVCHAKRGTTKIERVTNLPIIDLAKMARIGPDIIDRKRLDV